MPATDAPEVRSRLLPVAVGVSGACWGLALVGLGGVRMYAEWSVYNWERYVLRSDLAFSSLHVGLPLIALEGALGALLLLVTPVWLILVVVMRLLDRRRSTSYLVVAMLMVVVAAVTLTWSSVSSAWMHPGDPLHPHLVTAAFLQSLLLVCVGIGALAVTARMLVGAQP